MVPVHRHAAGASMAWIGATDSLVDKSQARTHSADRIIEVQHEVNEVFKKAKLQGDGGHYGIFKMVRLCFYSINTSFSVNNILLSLEVIHIL